MLILYTCVCAISLFGTTSVAHEDSTNSSTMYIVYNNTPNHEGVLVNAELMLTTNNIRLNAFELELHFDPDVHQIKDVAMHPGLCEPQFIIEKQIDVDEGIIYVACGTTTPFITGTEYMPIVTVAMQSSNSEKARFQFGPRTGFRMHDGFGTAAHVRVLQDEIRNGSVKHS